MNRLTPDILTGISSLLSLAGLWVLFFWLWRSYRLDRYRQQLFGVRDELFDLALSGAVRFDHPAYGMLRGTINGAIRYGHRLGLLDVVLLIAFLLPDRLARESARDFEMRWKEAVSSLPADTRQRVEALRTQLHYYMAEQVLFTSAFLLVTMVPIVLWAIIVHLGGKVRAAIRQLVGESLMENLAAEVDSAAFAFGADGG